MTINGADVNTSVTFTKIPVVEKVNISVSTQKSGTGPQIIMSASGGGDKEIGSTCNLSTSAQSYTDGLGNTTYPNFFGWWKDGVCVSNSQNYSFTVTKSESYTAKWSWN